MAFVRIDDPKKPGDYLVLAAAAFDQARHRLYEPLPAPGSTPLERGEVSPALQVLIDEAVVAAAEQLVPKPDDTVGTVAEVLNFVERARETVDAVREAFAAADEQPSADVSAEPEVAPVESGEAAPAAKSKRKK